MQSAACQTVGLFDPEYKTREKPMTPGGMAKIRREVIKGSCKNPDVAVLPASELQRIKHQTQIQTAAERQAASKLAGEQADLQQATNKAKAKRMQDLEADRQRVAPKLSDLEREDLEKRGTLVRRAEEIKNENKDEVKQMNQIINYAKCATVREKQIDEKNRIERQKIEETKRLDLMMEVERLKGIEKAEKIEKTKKVEIREGTIVIVDQIKEREVNRMLSKEEQFKEGQAMLRHVKQMELDEREKRQKAIKFQKTQQDEIYEANQAAIEKKSVKIAREREEEQKIIGYIKDKEQKEAEYLAEQKYLIV